MNWFYKDSVVEDDSIFPEGAIAFVYKITRIADGKFYIGKKLCHFTKTSVKTVTLKNGSKKKKKVKTLVPSDWKTYWSSSVELQKDVEKLGENAFVREILCFCANKGSASYYEARYQFDLRVMETDMSYNRIANLRVHSTHIRPIME